jgi:hypothetical protein
MRVHIRIEAIITRGTINATKAPPCYENTYSIPVQPNQGCICGM